MPTTDRPAGATALLAGCRDAEDYFTALGVDYDPRVLDVGRLHVLRLFGQELDGVDREDVDGMRAALERAYRALLGAGPLEHRVFKVLRDRAPGQFVPLAQVAVEAGVGLGTGTVPPIEEDADA